ncbi:MAG TPA: Nif3-like dinuclear metal center hexameric protein [Abditibacteriaceae bacterium]|jgi:dinuclear metal center YbgI/SA1388 family protein
MKIHEILTAIEARFPLARAEKWDKVGLQIGDAKTETSRILVAHEITPEVLEETQNDDCVVVYHPMIFRALENLNFADPTARLAAECIRRNLTVIAAHTALDNAAPPHALGDRLAQEIGLENIDVVAPTGKETLCKVVVFVPPEAREKVEEALWQAGAGALGNYERASFRTRGEGTFRPIEGANPYEGEVGKDELSDEWRVEVIAPEAQREKIVRAMKAAHPYEEVAYEIYHIYNTDAPYGSARAGDIPPTPLDVFAETVREKLNAPAVRLVRAGKHVSRIACVPGSGASFLDGIARAGCDCLVTGDIKHHDALKAKALGVSLVDVTHVATERSTVEMLAACFADSSVEVVRSAVETNPFS